MVVVPGLDKELHEAHSPAVCWKQGRWTITTRGCFEFFCYCSRPSSSLPASLDSLFLALEYYHCVLHCTQQTTKRHEKSGIDRSYKHLFQMLVFLFLILIGFSAAFHRGLFISEGSTQSGLRCRHKHAIFLSKGLKLKVHCLVTEGEGLAEVNVGKRVQSYTLRNRNPFDVHVYYNDQSREEAMLLREKMSLQFPWMRFHSPKDRPIGPHPVPMWEADFHEFVNKDKWEEVVDFISKEHGDLSVLIHPYSTDGDFADHTKNAYWVGTPLKLRLQGWN